MPRKLGITEAKQKAGRFCAYRERSPKEVSDKLLSWGLSEDEAADVLAQLKSENYVSEQRFANAFCHDKFEFNSWGKQKIRMYIRQHQIDPGMLEKALSNIGDEPYFNRLCQLATKKWEQLDEEDRMKRKQKTVTYLSNKGFEIDLIWKSIHQLEE